MDVSALLCYQNRKHLHYKDALTRWLILLGLLISLSSSVGCGTEGSDEPSDQEQSEQNPTSGLKADSFSDNPQDIDYSTKLAVLLEEGETFEFCTQPRSLNLNNAKWLAFIAANEYAHFGYLGPMMADLGFGFGAEGWFWGGCARDLYALRELLERGELSETLTEYSISSWGACAREWYEMTYLETETPPPANASAAFEHYLVQEVHPNSMLQFFSGGEFTVDKTEFKSGTSQVMWAQHSTYPVVLIAFRGTEIRDGQEADIWADLNFFQDEFIWGQVHGGFLSAFNSVEDQLLMTKLEEIKDQDVQIWITGHSLGAALATLLTAKILHKMDNGSKFNLKGLYTFGSPRVGNEEFADRFNESTARHNVSVMRFRNGADAVTRIPVSIPLIMKYKHVGNLVYLTQDGELLYNTDDVSRSVSGAFEDHRMVSYYEQINSHFNSGLLDVFNTCEEPEPEPEPEDPS